MKLSKRALEFSFILLTATNLFGCAGSDDSEKELPEATDSTIAEPDKKEDGDEASAEKPAEAPTETVDSGDKSGDAPSAELASPPGDGAAASAMAAAAAALPAHAAAPQGDGAAASAAAAAVDAAKPVPGAPYQAKGEGKKFWTFEDHVVIHAEPSAESAEIGVIDYGEVVDYLSQKHGWVKIGEGQYVKRHSLTDRKNHFYYRKKQDTAAATAVAH